MTAPETSNVPTSAPSAPPPAQLVERLTAGRPTNFPNVIGWLQAGVFRNLRGVVAALLAAWLYLPTALAAAVFYVVALVLFGSWADLVNEALLATVPFIDAFQEGVLNGVSTLVVLAITGILVGLLYTIYRVVCERWILRITGARRLSRREAELLLPIVRDCAARLGLSNHPPVLINDRRDANALAHARHIVINQGLLEEFNYDREAIAGIVCHELVHWRNGDPISAVFVRGVALPLYLQQAAGGWLLQRAGSSILLRFLIWFLFFPIFITVKYFVLPMQGADSRHAEYRADQGAVLAGHRVGMRRVLARFRQSFEGGRNGWVAAVCATHPPNELRLERLEEPGGHYPLPDEEGPPLPLPVTVIREG